MILTQSASMIVPLVPAMQHLYLSTKTLRIGRASMELLGSHLQVLGKADESWTHSSRDVKPVGIRMETVNMEAMIQESRWFEHVDFPSLAMLNYRRVI